MASKKKVVNFALATDQIDWLHEESRRRKASMSQIVRDLIQEARRRIFG